MDLINFHVHSAGSDGKRTPEEVVKEAIDSNIKYLCFTDHYFCPNDYLRKKSRKNFFNKNYIKVIKNLQKKYKSKINIFFGVEMDWFPNHLNWIKKEIKKYNFDYVIGSVHEVYIKKHYWPIFYGENWKEDWLASAKKVGGIRKFVEAYYYQIKRMAKSGLFDCVGHFDLIKLNNPENFFFSEKEFWYRKAVINALKEIKKANIAMEINTRGFIKYPKKQYPSFWILKEANRLGIPITIGTDSHREGQLTTEIEKAYTLARKAGYKNIVIFKERRRIPIEI